ncbi:flagellar motor switch protein FliN [bacterium BMS3Abin05]|nr:flagellar motor switch protein FliN [bacterium BMS3Abin05]GBE28834.1 flagellar motor switch protein FliN [bacterium BMS3Bbin03]HDL78191.1 flagellar motor switch protein FliN [Bacteroidota bacterium]HDZ11080.1 flagellar motor switch protein FliN [Bacteroidota bacterium]
MAEAIGKANEETVEQETAQQQNAGSGEQTVEDSTMVLNDEEEALSTESSAFQNMDEEEVSENNLNSLELLFDLELPVSVELAKKNVRISDILQLGEGSILEFDKMAGEPVDLLVNDIKIAEGEVVVIDDRFGIRVSNLLDPSKRLKGLK